MEVHGSLQVTLQRRTPDARVDSWSLPAWVVATKSATMALCTGDDDHVIIKSRIAESLNIQNDDEVDFLFNDMGETFRFKVTIRDDISPDVLIHDLFGLGLAESLTTHFWGQRIIFKSGKELYLPTQRMWTGSKIVEKNNSARLYFSGISQNRSNGPCGYGFHIIKIGTNRYDELIRGSGYGGMKNSWNVEIEYKGLIEGLTWAIRLGLQRLTVFGGSQLIIQQLRCGYHIRNNLRLKALHRKVGDLLYCNRGLEFNFIHIPEEENQITNSLANEGIATKVNVTTCNWPYINKMMARQGEDKMI